MTAIVSAGEVLLEGEVPIDRDECVELLLGEREELTVLDRRPADPSPVQGTRSLGLA